ncbi:Zinc finger CCCH domain-containing protein 16 [Heracleum sosnowskyi]|uniref:Zinc finger CCCH domain-containing protein 16 n=1 Tax=Heracleum sosnowskyi TaxID=360622 RepID=A0AAD8J9I5_9APIA|nr:Zinc finger CCCH domain-containing protein 16 [Heracleum sosnowskyi]
MPPKKELCRNFQRGSCQFGDRCKFLHTTPQQQTKAFNAFGFGSASQNANQFPRNNTQQQQPNPFGFGVQSNSQARGATDFGSKANQFKPFENKWSRSSSTPAGGSSVPQKSANQPPAPEHKCTDPESCKRQMKEDFEKEKPLWNLTCYGHVKNGLCDIVGDISYEELRALAYEDAKSGLTVQSIVEKERSLLQAKLLEFDGLLRNSNTFPPRSTLDTKNQFPGPSPNVFSPAAQNSNPPAFSSFSQLRMTPSAPVNAMAQTNPFQLNTQPSSGPGTVNITSASKGLFGSQLPTQPQGGSFPSIAANISTTGTVAERSIASQSVIVEMPKVKGGGDNSIWLKEEWFPGEIPEEAPPNEFIR